MAAKLLRPKFVQLFSLSNLCILFSRPSPQKSPGFMGGGHQIDADQLYPDDYNNGSSPAWRQVGSRTLDHSQSGGGFFNPLEAVVSSPRTSSPFRTLPRPQPAPYGGSPNAGPGSGMYSANNPLKDYGYPSDFGLPMTSMSSSINGGSGYITSNPLSELYEEREQKHQTPLMNMSNSSGSSTLSPPRGQTSSSGIGGDISTASGASTNVMTMLGLDSRGSPPMLTSSGGTPTPTGSSSSHGGSGGGAGPQVPTSAARQKRQVTVGLSDSKSKRESPDEGIQDDVSTGT